MTKKLNQVLAQMLTIAALMTGQEAWATEKTVTYTFTREDVSGDQIKLSFTRSSGSGFGNSGSKTVTFNNNSNCTGFSVELDDGVTLRYTQNAGIITFASSNGISNAFYLAYRANQNSRFTVSCTNYYICHIKFAEANGNVISGTGGSNALTCGSGPLTIYGATRAASSQQTIPGMLMESL